MKEISYKEAMDLLPAISTLWCCDYNIFYLDERGRVWFEPDDDYSDLMCWIDDAYAWVAESDISPKDRYKKYSDE